MAREESGSSCQLFPVQPPTSFNFDKASEWPAWVQEFDDYRFASGLNERTQEAQVRTLLYTMGRQARNVFKTFELSEEQSKDYEVVKKRFDAYFIATRNLVYESACFHRRHQVSGESVDQYVTALHTLTDKCDYGVMKERMILDRFVVGLRDTKLSEALQMDAALTLKTALTKARMKEAVQQQQQELHKQSIPPISQRRGRRNSSTSKSGTSRGPVGQRRRPKVCSLRQSRSFGVIVPGKRGNLLQVPTTGTFRGCLPTKAELHDRRSKRIRAYRDTPGPLGKTPAELLMGRRLRTTLPLHPNRLVPKATQLERGTEEGCGCPGKAAAEL
ncbi:uncharacterized protein LOC125946173 [Dermacentor silvarum]|uniref:uncharacterized protein LOC125946173 n=1 Tax=Dermacentor silvarum TaxID=543639 RepID=UPI0021009AF4|nr:uncharacterized protein LOC125946173 [Dermacentor silvarum]XP_049524626.1 uncharacterized protein LOC125946173 [Dermacentor silvarum]